MDEQLVRQIVQQEIQKNNSGSRFGFNQIPRHIHNNIDSPFTFQPTITYIGLIGLTGTIGILPTGWTVEYTPTGDYVVRHNLNTNLYSVVASPVGVEAIIQIITDKNTVEFDANGGGGPTDTPFYFILTNANNKSQTQLTYQTTVYTQTGVLI